MREILFRGKRKDNGEWVEGFLFDDGLVGSKRLFVGGIVIEDYKGTADDDYVITGSDFLEVLPRTVGQYTGITDRNGQKIFEGDIVKVDYDAGCCIISWDEDSKKFTFERPEEMWGFEDIGYDVIVVGNLFDNPDLADW